MSVNDRGSAVVALAMLFSVSSAAGAAAPAAVAKPGIRSLAARANAAAPSYSIHNLGFPSGYPASTPTGFNSTGQIFGLIYRPTGNGGETPDCRLWTGSSFQRLPLPATGSCAVLDMSDANATSGEYEVVGSAQEEFSESSRAFAIVVGTAAYLRTTIYYANSPSLAVSVNAAQTALAVAAFERDTLPDYDGLLYFTTAHAGSFLTTLQAPAAANAPPIHNVIPLQTNAEYPTPCVFGGCALNGRDAVLGYDQLTNQNGVATLAMYTIGKPSSLVHLPISSSSASAPVAFNDLDQLVYFDIPLAEPAVYDVDTGVRIVLPVLPAGCPSYATGVPLSMNDHGEVLGIIFGCPNHAAYWTWDASRGTQYLDAQLPSNAYTIYPLGVNDNGQILVRLVDAANVDYWGTLDPVVSGSSKAKLRR